MARFNIEIHRPIGERQISFAIESDAPLLFLTGASGTGKTSILNMIAGLMRPASGRIAIDGTVLFDAAIGIDIEAARRGAGYQFQDNRLFPHLTVAQNMAFAEGGPPPAINRDILVERLGLAHLLDRRPRTLSGGEARRVALARALLSARTMLLLDEPTASLNPGRQDDVRTLIADWCAATRLPAIIASHDSADRDRLSGDMLDLDSL